MPWWSRPYPTEPEPSHWPRHPFVPAEPAVDDEQPDATLDDAGDRFDDEVDADTIAQLAALVRPTYLVSWVAGVSDLLYTEGVELDYVGRIERGHMTLIFDGDPKAPSLALELPTERIVSIVRTDLIEEDDEDDDGAGPGGPGGPDPDGPDPDPTPDEPGALPERPALRLVLAQDMPDDLASIAAHPAGQAA